MGDEGQEEAWAEAVTSFREGKKMSGGGEPPPLSKAQGEFAFL